MTQQAGHDSGSEESRTFPACCKDAAEKMSECGPMMEKMTAHCGPMMEKMMAHCGPMMEKMMGSFGAKTSDGESNGCCAKPEERTAD